MKKRIVVVCPGRGSYTKENLNYLAKARKHIPEFIADIDRRRSSLGEPTITDLDEDAVFKPGLHTRGEHASALIYACAFADFMAIDREKYEIVAVTGNSMGWYLTLAFAGALNWAGAFSVINTMGSMMKEEIIGGQVIYPVSDSNWIMSPKMRETALDAIRRVNESGQGEAHVSIELGGYLVIGGDKPGVAALLKALPPVENYPFQLINHAAFHTPVLRETSNRAFELLPPSLFQKPELPMIDGEGRIWRPYSTDLENLYHYTLGTQVVEPYDFTRAITVALKEFAPDHLVLLGPGGSLGGSIGQILIQNDWRGLKSKAQFTEMQSTPTAPLIAMGRMEQRGLIATF